MATARDFDLPADCAFTVRPVAVFRSPHRVHHDAPRQPRTDTSGSAGGGEGRRGRIVVRQGLQNLLQDLAGFSHLWVLFWCHHADGYNDLVTPPRDTRKRGLFATRAPHRPNPLGLSALELVRIEKRTIVVGDHDLLDGTPILDLKPYIPAYDSIPQARAGWVDELGSSARPDHREWWTELGLPPPYNYRHPPDD